MAPKAPPKNIAVDQPKSNKALHWRWPAQAPSQMRLYTGAERRRREMLLLGRPSKMKVYTVVPKAPPKNIVVGQPKSGSYTLASKAPPENISAGQPKPSEAIRHGGRKAPPRNIAVCQPKPNEVNKV